MNYRKKYCHDILNQFHNIDINEFIIMDNYIHGIIIRHKRTGASPVPTILFFIFNGLARKQQ